MKSNYDIRAELGRRGIKHYQVAAEMGVSYSTFSHWLQLELSEENKQEIMAAINRICEVRRMTKGKELRPCPFCGGTAVVKISHEIHAFESCFPERNYWAICTKCDASTGEYEEAEEAAEAWNRRT